MDCPIIMILGWRSGTSSLTKNLYEDGFPVTPPLDMRPMEGHQPEGHYENTQVYQINEALLKHFNMTIFQPGLLPFTSADVVENWLGEHPEPIIVKDPRFAFTWPVWTSSTHRRCIFVWTDRETTSQVSSIVRWYQVPEGAAASCVRMHDLCADMACRSYLSLRLDLLEEGRYEKGADFIAGYVKRGSPERTE